MTAAELRREAIRTLLECEAREQGDPELAVSYADYATQLCKRLADALRDGRS